MIRTIFLKELRENARYGLGLCAAVAIALSLAMQIESHRGFTLVEDVFQGTTAASFAAAGLILGLLQVLQDSTRGRWAFLTHRPISRGGIFAGKLFAGLLLYFLACGLPLFVTLLFASPPFEWRMALPSLTDLLCGTVWYFAAMLVGVRPAHWLGSRVLPLSIAFAASLYTFGPAQTFGEAVLAIAIALTIVVTAAWGAFTTDGRHERQPLLARAISAGIIALGAFLVLFLSSMFAHEFLRMMLRPRQAVEYSNYIIDTTGRPLISHTKYPPGSTHLTDLAGNPLPGGDASRVYEQDLPTAFVSFSSWLHPIHRQFRRPMSYGGRINSMPDTRWYYVAGRRTIEGFDQLTGRRIGSLGPDGFRPFPQSPQPFPEPLDRSSNDTTLLAGARTVYRLDLANRTVHRLMDAGPDDEILDATSFVAAGERDRWNTITGGTHVAVLTRSELHLFGPDELHVTLPVQAAREYGSHLRIGRTSDGAFVVMDVRDPGPHSTGPLGELLKLSTEGGVIARTELPALPRSIETTPRWLRAIATVAAPPPLLLIPSEFRDWPEMRRSNAMAPWVLLLGVLAAITNVVIGRRSAFSIRELVTWGAIGLLAGITGTLALLCVRQLPQRVTCLRCKKPRVVTRDRCEHCDAPFNPPAHEGIEVFEPASATA